MTGTIGEGAQFALQTNVCIRKFDKEGRFLQEVRKSNRVTKSGLMDLVRFTGGYLNPSMPGYNSFLREDEEDGGFPFYPRYVALGTNIPDANSTGDVSTIVTVNDSHLLAEIMNKNTNDTLRVKLQQNNSISNYYTDPYIKLTLQCIIQTNIFESYKDEQGNTPAKEIGEVGLFTKKKGNNCWARIVLDKPILKEPDSVLDITWDLVFVSVQSENVPYEDLDSEDLKRLKSMVREYSSLVEEKYTEESWKGFAVMLNLANAVINYNNSSEYLIQLTIQALEDAKNNLQEK